MLRAYAVGCTFVGILFLAPSSSADAPKPPAITVESVPAVPDELADRLRQYQDARNATFAGWAPDGKGILIGTRFANTVQLHRVYTPGGRREQVTFFSEPVKGQFLGNSDGGPSGDLLFTASKGGSENDQVYFVDSATGKTHLLTDGKSRHGLGPVRKDGSRMVVVGNQRNGKDSDVYIGDPRKPGSLELVLEGHGESWQPMDWSPDGFRIVLNKYVSINESYPVILDVVSRKLTPIPLPDGKKGAFTNLKFAPDGKSVYLATDARGEFRELANVELATGKYTWLSGQIKWNVEEVAIPSRVGPLKVAFSVNEKGKSRLYIVSVGEYGSGLFSIRRPPEGVISGLSISPAADRLGFTFAGPDLPSDVVDVPVSHMEYRRSHSDAEPDDEEKKLPAIERSLRGGREDQPLKRQRWTFSETGGLPASTFSGPELIEFPSFDKRKIPAFVFKPRNVVAGQRVPVVVMIHGGPEAQYRPVFNGFDQFLVNELGVAVIWPNVRGSDGYGKSYLLLDNAEKRQDSVNDIGGLLDWVAKQPDLDASRVAVMGGSYGGFMVLASLTSFPERIKAGVDIVGISNFVTFLQNTSAYRRDQRRAEYGDERDPKMKEVFEKVSPANHVDRIKSALMVIHGRNDPRVPFSEAEQIASKVKALGRPVWSVYADNEGHGFQKKENRDYMNQAIVLFFRENLLGK